MLGEMSVKFGVDESVDELKRRLQQENHSLWLKSVNANRASADRSGTVVIRKRKDLAPPQEPVIDKQADSNSLKPKAIAASRDPDRRRQWSESPRHRHTIEKPAPGKPWKAAAEGTQTSNCKKNVFASVLRRAHMCCELCGIAGDAATATLDLHPFHIQPLDEGGEHSVKKCGGALPGL